MFFSSIQNRRPDSKKVVKCSNESPEKDNLGNKATECLVCVVCVYKRVTFCRYFEHGSPGFVIKRVNCQILLKQVCFRGFCP